MSFHLDTLATFNLFYSEYEYVLTYVQLLESPELQTIKTLQISEIVVAQQDCFNSRHVFTEDYILESVVFEADGCQVGELTTFNVELRQFISAQVYLGQLTDVELLEVDFLQFVLREVKLLKSV